MNWQDETIATLDREYKQLCARMEEMAKELIKLRAVYDAAVAFNKSWIEDDFNSVKAADIRENLRAAVRAVGEQADG